MTRSPLISFVCVLGLAACNAQIYPKPMEQTRKNLPPGATSKWSAGPEEVTVVRHADPVRLRMPGSTAGVPVHFYEKTQRVHSGTGVIAAAGGKAEVIWPLGTSIILFGPATGVIGSTSRGEPTFSLEELGRARLDLREGDAVRLVGGAVLTGSSGPYLLDRVSPEVTRVTNQSKQPVTIAYRSGEFELGPGQRIDLPLVSSGSAPQPGAEGFRTVAGPGFGLDVRGDVTARTSDGAVDVSATGVNELRGLGVKVQLEPGDSARFSGLGRPEEAPESAPESAPEPAPESPEEPAPDPAAAGGVVDGSGPGARRNRDSEGTH